MSSEPHADTFTLHSSVYTTDVPETKRCLTFDMKSIVEMKTGGVDHPYIQKAADASQSITVSNSSETSVHDSESDENLAPSGYVFTLLHTRLETFFTNIHVLYEVANRPKRSLTKQEEQNLLAPVFGPRLFIEFDPSLLVDFREKLLLSEGKVVERIEPLVKHPGRVMFTTERLYFQPMQLNNVLDPVLHWAYSDIAHMYKRRHLLRQTGLEIFSYDDESVFFSFQTRQERDELYALMVDQPELAHCQRTDLSYMMQQWQQRQISNYDYLLFLNNAAGRTVNDLTQYPVFPWILSNYVDDEIDLDDPTNYRDLSKPVGALNPDRLTYFRQRFEMMPRGEEAEGLPPPFLYGTHYSTPGYVLYYLVRMMPGYMLCLQNGKFDDPDRLFQSIQKTWEGVCTNYADLKELIPEFFDTDEHAWLRNQHGLDFGYTQEGKRVTDVELPPWAHDNPQTFIQINRQALESAYVSDHLHEWIDLIFGYKQQGEEAIKADNLFYHLSYEGAVDLETVEDATERQSIEAQIQEFGQTPKQLFSSPHPCRNEPNPMVTNVQVATKDLLPSPRVDIDTLVFKRQQKKDPSVIAQENLHILQEIRRKRSRPHLFSEEDEVERVDRSVDCIDPFVLCLPILLLRSCVQTCLFDPLYRQFQRAKGTHRQPKSWQWHVLTQDRSYRWMLRRQQRLHEAEVTSAVLSQYSNAMYTTSKDQSLQTSFVGSNDHNVHAKHSFALSCCDLSPDETYLFVGCWDNHVYMCEAATGNLMDKVEAHVDGISALKVAKDVLVTASWDSTVKLWQYSSSRVRPVPLKVFRHSVEAVISLDVSEDGSLAIAGARKGHLYLFDINRKKLLRPMLASPKERGDVVSVCFGNNASSIVCVTTANEVRKFTLMGECLLTIYANIPGQLRCLESDGMFAVGGTTDGSLIFWMLMGTTKRLEPIAKIPHAHRTIVSALTVSSSGSVVVSCDDDGRVSVWQLLQQPALDAYTYCSPTFGLKEGSVVATAQFCSDL